MFFGIIKSSPEVELDIIKSIKTNKATKEPFKNWIYKNPVVITTGVDAYTWSVDNTLKMPLYVIFAFQIDKDYIERDNTKFEFNKLKNIKLMLNNKKYTGIINKQSP